MTFGLLFGALSLSAQVEIGPLGEGIGNYLSPELVHENDSHLFFVARLDIGNADLMKVNRTTLEIERHSIFEIHVERKMEHVLQRWMVRNDTLVFFVYYDHRKEKHRELWVHQMDLNSGEVIAERVLKHHDYHAFMDQNFMDIWYHEKTDHYYLFEIHKGYKGSQIKETLSILSSSFEELNQIDYASNGPLKTSIARPLFGNDGSVFFFSPPHIIHLDAQNDFESSSVSIPENLIIDPLIYLELQDSWLLDNGNPMFHCTHKKHQDKMSFPILRAQESSELKEGIYLLEYDLQSKTLKPAIKHRLQEGSMKIYTYFGGMLSGPRTPMRSAFGASNYPESGLGHDVASLQDSSGNRFYTIAHTNRSATRVGSNLFSSFHQYDRFVYTLDNQYNLLWYKNIDYLSKSMVNQFDMYVYDAYLEYKFLSENGALLILYNELDENLTIDDYEEREPLEEVEDGIPVIDKIDPATGEHVQIIVDHLLDPEDEDLYLDVHSLFKSTIDNKYYYILSEEERLKVARASYIIPKE
ncbi:MAG: hypothetical protein NXI09_05935 [Bacteroidetes bacterium]|nr:hypothetical protein [Bacteroidota bacterium]